MAIVRLNNWTITILDSDGNPAEGYQVKAFIDGSTTPTDTYTDISGTTAAWPLVVPSNGVLDIYISEALVYKFEIFKSDGSTKVRTISNISGTGGGIASGVVYTDAGDETPGFLASKIAGGTNITITVDDTTDPSDHKLIISAAGATLNDLQGAYDDGNTILVASERPIDITKNYIWGDSDWITYAEDSDIPGSDKRFAVGNDELRMSDTSDQYVMLSTRSGNARFTLTEGKYLWKEDSTTSSEYFGAVITKTKLGLVNQNVAYDPEAYFTVGSNSATSHLRGTSSQYVRETVRSDSSGGWSRGVYVPNNSIERYDYTSSGTLYTNDSAGIDGQHNTYLTTSSWFERWSSAFVTKDEMASTTSYFRNLTDISGFQYKLEHYRNGGASTEEGDLNELLFSVSTAGGEYGRAFTIDKSSTRLRSKVYRDGMDSYHLDVNTNFTSITLKPPSGSKSITMQSRDDAGRGSDFFTNDWSTTKLRLSDYMINKLDTGIEVDGSHIYSKLKRWTSTGTGSISIDLSTANFHSLDATADTSIDIDLNSGADGASYGIILSVNAGTTVTWGLGVTKWPGGVAPTFPTTGEYMVTFLYDYLIGKYALSVSEAFA